MSAAAAAARSVFRSSAAVRTASLASIPKSRPAPASFRLPKQTPISVSQRFLRSPVELSCCVETMLPYHTATASALLNSMLSVSRNYGWTPEELSLLPSIMLEGELDCTVEMK